MLLTLLVAPAWGQIPELKPAELFAWFDRLGFEDVSNAKFVRIRTGASSVLGGTRREDDVSYGFLLEDKGGTFQAVLADLTVGLFEKKGTDESDPDYCGYRDASIAATARQALHDLRNPKCFANWESEHSYHYYDRLPRHAQVFVLARRCAQKGYQSLAKQLMAALAKHSIDDGANRGRDFPEWLVTDMSRALNWRAQLAFRDPAKSWNDIRDRYRRVLEMCPGAYEARDAREMVAKIDILIAEEKEHVTTGLASIDELPLQKRAEELVWRLRDDQMSEAGPDVLWPRPWPSQPRGSNGAMKALLEMGFDAVPALLAELQREEHLARSISRLTRYGGGMVMTDTHGLATEVLNGIAGLNFYWMSSSQTREELRSNVLREAEAWWQQVQAKGERAWLNELVRAGGRRGLNCADQLLQKFPDDFVDAAIAGIKACDDPEDPYPHRELVSRLAKQKDPRVDDFLLAELKRSALIHEKVSLAQALRERNQHDAEGIMRNEWNTLIKADFNGAPPSSPFINGGPMDGASAMLGFLAASESAETMQAVLASWPKLGLSSRVALIDIMSRRDLTKSNPEVKGTIESLLFEAIDDTRESGVSYGFDGGSVNDPRICDLAADALRGHWPERFQFDRLALESTRERQRLILINQRRLQIGLEEIPLPSPRTKVEEGKANCVTAVEWAKESESPSKELDRKLSSLKGKPLPVGTLVGVLANYARSPQPKTSELRIQVTRDGDDTGVIMRVSLAPRIQEASARNMRALVKLDREVLHSVSGVGSPESYSTVQNWSDFATAANKAVKAPVTKPFMIKASISVSDAGTLK